MTTSFISASYALVNNPVLSIDNKKAIEAAIREGRLIVQNGLYSSDAEFEALLNLCGKLSGFLFRHYN